MSNLTEARFRYQMMDAIRGLLADGRITDEDVPHIATLPFPKSQEELPEFILPLFLHGISKALPGCPVRNNEDAISIRLDGEQYRKAKEVRQIMERSAVRQYISEKDRSTYRVIDGRMSDRITRLASQVRENDRDFYHIKKENLFREYDFAGNYSQLIRQGLDDAALVGVYDRVMQLVEQRQEEKRGEFLRIRKDMNEQFVTHAGNIMRIPFSFIERLGAEGKALVEQLRARGFDAFYRKPTLQELASTEISVDVFSALDEADESWYIAPVTLDILTSNEERLYHGQGTITSYDPESEYSLGGRLPFEVQHCIRTAANYDTFIAALPETIVNAMNASEELAQQLLGRDSTGITKDELRKLPSVPQEAAPVAEGQEEVSGSAVDALYENILAQIAKKPPVKGKPTPKAKAEAKSLADILQEAVADSPKPEVVTQAPDGEAVVMHEAEPVQPTPVAPVEEADYQQPDPEEREEEGSHGLQIKDVHHESHGYNPIFYQMVADPTGDGQLVQYVAFRGIDARFFMNFNEAAIYSGKPIGTFNVYPFANRFVAVSEMPDGTALRQESYDGLLL